MAHSHSHIPEPVTGRRLFGAIVFNIIITAAEAIGGFITGYLALLADAVHNLSDVAALGLAWLGHRASERPATKSSTYGFKRVEVMTALISAVALVVIAIFILIEAYHRLREPRVIDRPGIFLTVAVIGLIGNLVSIWFLHARKSVSLNLKTAFLHMFYDALSSAVVIAGGVVIWLTGWYQVDVILSAAIAVMIFWSSWLVIKEAVQIFLEAAPARLDFDEVHDAISKMKLVQDVHDLHIWSLSSNEVALSCHVCVEPDDLRRGPDLITRIDCMLREQFEIGHSTIQLESEPCERGDILCGNNGNDNNNTE